MFHHVLVPHDLSTRSRRAVETARELAARDRAQVTLLHVIQRIEHIAPAEMRRFYAELERNAARRMAAAERLLARAGVGVRTAVLIGVPAREILRFAAANKVDLIVMGSHRIDAEGGARGWGTTSYKVGILCPCPVMLVK